MELKFFDVQKCTKAQDVKAQYRDLIKKHHPDKGGKTADMQQINAEYEYLMKAGLESVKNSTDINEQRAWSDYKQYADILQKIIFLEGLKIEIIGSWLWLSGNTYTHYETIKNAGFRFSASKKSWYWYNGIDTAKHYRGRYNMAQLRAKHGAVVIESEEQKKIKAA